MVKYRVKEVIKTTFDFVNVKEKTNKKYIVQKKDFYYDNRKDEYGNIEFNFLDLFIGTIIVFLIIFKIYKKQWYEIYSYNNKKDALTVLNYLKKIDKDE